MIYYEREDFSVTFEDLEIPQLLIKCKKCTWETDLNKLDTLMDIWDELQYHDDYCFEWSNHEVSSTN